MVEDLSWEFAFQWNARSWFSVYWVIPKRGIWRWEIKRPFTIERLDQ